MMRMQQQKCYDATADEGNETDAIYICHVRKEFGVGQRAVVRTAAAAAADSTPAAAADPDHDDDTSLPVHTSSFSTSALLPPRRLQPPPAVGGATRRDDKTSAHTMMMPLNTTTASYKVAVHDLCLSIRCGERFGFLGSNGAGKSTTLSIVAGQQAATSGDVFIRVGRGGVVSGVSSVTSGPHKAAARRLLGNCPQHSALLEHLTADEQVSLCGRLKGMRGPGVERQAAELLRSRCGLRPDMCTRPVGTLSGGNQRKVSLALALVGSPVAVLLDEPSSGMDPGSRRRMWDAILQATSTSGGGSGGGDCFANELAPYAHRHYCLQPQRTGLFAAAAVGGDGRSSARHGAAQQPQRLFDAAALPVASHQEQQQQWQQQQDEPPALVLTSHYMEEVEVLCDRVGIMTGGRLACVGSPQELKSRFGGHHVLEVHYHIVISSTTAAVDATTDDTAGSDICSSSSSSGGALLLSSSVTVARTWLLLQLRERFGPGLRVLHHGSGVLKAEVPVSPYLSLGRAFRHMEEVAAAAAAAAAQQSPPAVAAAAPVVIDSYCISQPTLEQVFMNVVGHSLAQGEAAAGPDDEQQQHAADAAVATGGDKNYLPPAPSAASDASYGDCSSVCVAAAPSAIAESLMAAADFCNVDDWPGEVQRSWGSRSARISRLRPLPSSDGGDSIRIAPHCRRATADGSSAGHD